MTFAVRTADPTGGCRVRITAISLLAVLAAVAGAQYNECPNLYGIHDHDPFPAEFLSRVEAAGRQCYVTSTVAIGYNPADTSGVDFTAFENRGHTVICRLNNGYCDSRRHDSAARELR